MADYAERVVTELVLEDGKFTTDTNRAAQNFDRAMSDIERSATRAEGAARSGGEGIGRSMEQAGTKAGALGHQVSDLTGTLGQAGPAFQGLAGKGAEVAESLIGASGAASGFAGVLTGPWAAAGTVALAFLADLVLRNFEYGNAVAEAVEKLREHARQTDIDREAQAIFANSLDGVRDATRRTQEALEQLDRAHETGAQRALDSAAGQIVYARATQATTRALLQQRLAELGSAGRDAGPNADPTDVHRAEVDAESAVRQALTELQNANQALDTQINQLAEAMARRSAEIGERLSSEAERIRERYDNPNTGLIALERRRLTAAHATTEEIIRQTAALAAQRDAEVRATQQRDRDARRRPRAEREPSDGVSRFRSREQAIGMAGRELQGLGFRVSENEQFGGVRSNHTYAQHGLYAIDVNIGTGLTEANDPGARERMDAAARSYQSRGYRVLWNGRIYLPGQDGPGPPIPRGRGVSQHLDHLHLEAPASIVGRPAGSAGGLRQDLRTERAVRPARPGDVNDPRNSAADLREAFELAQELAAITDRPGGIIGLTPEQILGIDHVQLTIEDLAEIAAGMPSIADGLLPQEDQERLERFQNEFQRDLVGGLVEAAIRGEDLGDTLVRVFQRAASELITSGLLDLLSGRGLGNTLIGNLLGGGRVSLGGGKGIPKFASGGSMLLGGFGGIDQNVLSLNGKPLAMVSRGEGLHITPQGRNPGASAGRARAMHGAGAGGGITVNVFAEDAVLTHAVRGWVAQGIQVATQAGSEGGAVAVGRRSATLARQTIP